MNTRRLLRGGVWFLLFCCLWLPLFDDPPLHSGAFVQGVDRDRGVVALIGRSPERLAAHLLPAEGDRRLRSLVEDDAQRRHRFEFDGLAPGELYRYEVRTAEGDAMVDAGSFRTAPADDQAAVRFAVVGDSGGLPGWVWLQRSALFWLPAARDWLPAQGTVSAIGARIAAASPDFVLHVGDVVYPWGLQAHYGPGFFRPFAAALRTAPFYLALGNHDVMNDAGRQLLANFELPRGTVTGDERCYSFARGALRVVVLDLQGPVDAAHPAARFLRRELERCAEPWLVVASHYPIQSASRQRDRADLMLEVLPLLREYGVDLYLAGHDHTYQRFGVPGELIQVVSGAGGKSLYEVRPDRRAQVLQSQYHWCSVDVAGPTLRLRAHTIEGATIDTVELRKAASGPRFAAMERLQPDRAARVRALAD